MRRRASSSCTGKFVKRVSRWGDPLRLSSVDDGSCDQTFGNLEGIDRQDARAKGIQPAASFELDAADVQLVG